MGANGCLELSRVVTAFRGIRLTRVTPERSFRNGNWSSHLQLVRHLRVRLPVRGGVAHAFLCSFCIRHHRLRLWRVILRPSRVLKQFWLVHHFVLDCNWKWDQHRLVRVFVGINLTYWDCWHLLKELCSRRVWQLRRRPCYSQCWILCGSTSRHFLRVSPAWPQHSSPYQGWSVRVWN